MKFIVDPNDAKKRLDIYFSEKIGISRSARLHIINRE